MQTETAPRHLDDVSLLRAVGESVLGRNWRRPLARLVGVSGSLLCGLDGGAKRLSPAVRQRIGRWAATQAAVEVERARRRIGLLAEARDRFVGTL